jgi:microcin C transport system substrate-binding protein
MNGSQTPAAGKGPLPFALLSCGATEPASPERIVFAEGRDDLVAATRALDRVLLWNHYVVPQWNFNTLRTARWDRFGHPAPMPKYGLSAFPTLWWWNEERGAK